MAEDRPPLCGLYFFLKLRQKLRLISQSNPPDDRDAPPDYRRLDNLASSPEPGLISHQLGNDDDTLNHLGHASTKRSCLSWQSWYSLTVPTAHFNTTPPVPSANNAKSGHRAARFGGIVSASDLIIE